MAQVQMYVVGASSDPNSVKNCAVPWRVDEKLIFFGPCMKGPRGIREPLRKKFLGPNCTHKTITDDLFIFGVNASNKEKIRKVVWAGKLLEVMTFEEADKRLKGDRFQKLRNHQCSPLHVCPLSKDGKLIGYKHVSDEHINKEGWVSDLVSKSARGSVLVVGRNLILQQGTPWQAFDRDCCMLLKNIFFASGQGIEFDEEALGILRQAQPEKSDDISRYAVFGLRANGQADGLRGRFLKINGDLANQFIAWLEDRSRKVTKHQWSEGYGPTKTCCT